MKPQQNQSLEQKIENIPTDFEVHKKGQTTIRSTTAKKLDLKTDDYLYVEIYKIYDGTKLVASLAPPLSFIKKTREKNQMTIDAEFLKLLDIKEGYILEAGVHKVEPYKYK